MAKGRCENISSSKKGADVCCVVLFCERKESMVGVVGCYWVLVGVFGCCWVLLGVVGCCWVLLGVVGCCWMLLDVVGCC